MASESDLVAVGGSLEPEVVYRAYRRGIFPWFDEGQPVLWWSPDPRAVLPLDAVHRSRRMQRTLRSGRFRVRLDAPFEAVMRACGEGRPEGTWIHEDMVRCYRRLHDLGHAHALGVYAEERLVGGIYGVAFGGGFAAESMFHTARDASKVALLALVDHLRARGFRLLDVQFWTAHLARFGVREIPRVDYLEQVQAVRDLPVTWQA